MLSFPIRYLAAAVVALTGLTGLTACSYLTPYRIEIRIDIEDDRVTVVDGTGSDDQAKGPINYLLHPDICRMMFSRFLLRDDRTVTQNQGAYRAIGEVKLRPGSERTRTLTGWPTLTLPRSYSATSASTHIVEMSPIRNRVSPAAAFMPSTAERCSTTPSRADDQVMAIGTFRVRSISSMTASETLRFCSRRRAPSKLGTASPSGGEARRSTRALRSGSGKIL